MLGSFTPLPPGGRKPEALAIVQVTGDEDLTGAEVRKRQGKNELERD